MPAGHTYAKLAQLSLAAQRRWPRRSYGEEYTVLANPRHRSIPGSKGLWSPRWSPDGRHILALNTAGTELMIFDFRKQEWSSLAKLMTVAWPEWSRNSDYIYFLGIPAGGEQGVYRVRVSDHSSTCRRVSRRTARDLWTNAPPPTRQSD